MNSISERTDSLHPADGSPLLESMEGDDDSDEDDPPSDGDGELDELGVDEAE